jgi:hypothetical protein
MEYFLESSIKRQCIQCILIEVSSINRQCILIEVSLNNIRNSFLHTKAAIVNFEKINYLDKIQTVLPSYKSARPRQINHNKTDPVSDHKRWFETFLLM